MLRNLFVKTLRDRSKSLIGWSIGIGVLAVITIAFFPMIRDNPTFEAAMEDLPEGLRIFIGDNPLTSPAGYLESQLYQYLIPLLFMIYGIGQAADTIAGEESRKTIDLLLANPITRGKVVVQKFAAIAVGIAWLALLLFAALWVGAQIVDMDITTSGLSAATLGAALLSLAFAALALLLAATTGKKGLSLGVSAALAAASYFWYSLAPVVPELEPYRRFSPFHLYIGTSPLTEGFSPLHLAALAAAIVVLVVAAAGRFERRDIAT